ncbi:hypothetical protein FOCC_FOCC003561 [Frankliniella occidentalis]|nr:hypothetical protein FOCC_FOCC003561 [Frankliniella occidentalis]
MYPCGAGRCPEVFRSITDLCTHMSTGHSVSLTGFTCKYVNCGRSFGSISSLRKHLLNHPGREQIVNVVQNVPIAPQLNINEQGEALINVDQNIDEPMDNEPAVRLSDEDICENLSNSALRFVSKLYSIGTMNRSDVDLIVKFSQELIQSIVCNIRSKGDIPPSVLSALQVVEGTFTGLETESHRYKALTLSGAYVPPEPFNIDYSTELVGNEQPVLKQVPLIGQFVPMRIVLKMFFELPGVYDVVMEN